MAFRNNFEELDTILFSWYLFVSGLLFLEFMPILRITVVGVWRGLFMGEQVIKIVWFCPMKGMDFDGIHWFINLCNPS